MKIRSELKSALFLGTILLFLSVAAVTAAPTAAIHLRITGINNPAGEIIIELESSLLPSPLTRRPDASAQITFFGLPAGSYLLKIKTASQGEWKQELILEPGQFLHFHLHFSGPSRPPELEIYDSEDFPVQTTVTHLQFSRLPSADNLWSIIENQDLSATTNRIDSGGLWADTPALFSARGGCSWTQNEIRLNGFNLTDPLFGGTPLFIPDLQAIHLIQHRNAFHPVTATSPGGVLEMETMRGDGRLRGGMAYSLIEPFLTSSNITPALRDEGITDSHTFKHDRKLRFWLSGPLLSKERGFFLSFLSQDLSRHIADYEGNNRSRLISGTVRLDQATSWGNFVLFWTGQQISEDEAGARRKMAIEATVDASRKYHVAQAFWKSPPSSHHAFQAGLSLAYAKTATSPHRPFSGLPSREIFRPLAWHAPLRFGEEEKVHLNFQARGTSLLGSPLFSHHLFNYGFELSRRSSSSFLQVPGNTHLLFLEGQPSLVALFRPPSPEKQAGLEVSLYLEDRWSLSRFLIIQAGARFVLTRGWTASPSENKSFGGFSAASSSSIEWLTALPRLSLTIPFAEGRKGFLKFFYGQTAFSLPLNYLRWGNPGAEGALIHSWQDLNKNSRLDNGELGPLLRREGPFFSRIDPDLRRPITTEYGVSLVRRWGKDFFLSLSGFIRKTRHLIETQNIGVPETAYETLIIEDSGDDRIPGTHDDLVFPIFNRLPQALGRDFFLLTNPDAEHRTSRYRGLDLILLRRFRLDDFFFFSFTATEAIGTTSPGNSEWENDDVLLGWLYDDPNSLINSRGRLRFDRAYTARLGFSLRLPAGFQAGVIFKYYDGQPFSRKILITGLNQGPLFIQAFPRGIARYEFNMTADFRLEKIIRLSGWSGRVFIEGYNIFNQHLATEENEWTSPLFPLRLATEIQSPRVFRLGLVLEF